MLFGKLSDLHVSLPSATIHVLEGVSWCRLFLSLGTFCSGSHGKFRTFRRTCKLKRGDVSGTTNSDAVFYSSCPSLTIALSLSLLSCTPNTQTTHDLCRHEALLWFALDWRDERDGCVPLHNNHRAPLFHSAPRTLRFRLVSESRIPSGQLDFSNIFLWADWRACVLSQPAALTQSSHHASRGQCV